MSYKKVTKISAIGTKGAVKGKVFTAKQDSAGRYVLNKKTTKPGKGNSTNEAVNKAYVNTLTEAANLLSTDDYLINLVASTGQRALREYKKVKIESLL